MPNYIVHIDRRTISRRTLAVSAPNRESLTRELVFGDPSPRTGHQPLIEWMAVDDESDDYEVVWHENHFITEIEEIE